MHACQCSKVPQRRGWFEKPGHGVNDDVDVDCQIVETPSEHTLGSEHTQGQAHGDKIARITEAHKQAFEHLQQFIDTREPTVRATLEARPRSGPVETTEHPRWPLHLQSAFNPPERLYAVG